MVYVYDVRRDFRRHRKMIATWVWPDASVFSWRQIDSRCRTPSPVLAGPKNVIGAFVDRTLKSSYRARHDDGRLEEG
jgi:hypothetical protein